MPPTSSSIRPGLSVSGDDPEGVISFVLERTGGRRGNLKVCTALGAYRAGRLLGGFVYTNYFEVGDTGLHTVNMHMAGDPGWLTRQTLRSFYRYPFWQLKCCRVIGNIKATNLAARRVAEGMGCTLDGIIRSGISEDFDTCVYTMTAAECRWL